MAEFVYVLRPTRSEMVTEGPTPEESEVLQAHVAYLQDLAEKGTVILFGRTQEATPATFGLVIFESATDEAARALMNGDPAVAGGVMRAELFPYRIAGMRG